VEGCWDGSMTSFSFHTHTCYLLLCVAIFYLTTVLEYW
jgi:hypothetical protein